MKAVRLHTRGGPEQVVIDEIPLPQPQAGELRIRVIAAALTPGELTWDETYRNSDGTPRIPTIPGHDVAGIVDALGPGDGEAAVNDNSVSAPAVGLAVFALVNFPLNGSAAEFVIVPATDVALAPKSIDPTLAAAVPLSALTAFQGLFDHGKLEAGQRVLIHGGAGGVGAFAVQLARWRGAHVIATTSTANIAMVSSLGANEVIDYNAAKFEEKVRECDVVFDTVGGETLTRSLVTLRRGGRAVSIAAMPDADKATELGITGKFFVVRPSREQLTQIASLIDSANLKVHIEQIFPLSRARQAFERSISGHLRGKVVLRIE